MSRDASENLPAILTGLVALVVVLGMIWSLGHLPEAAPTVVEATAPAPREPDIDPAIAPTPIPRRPLPPPTGWVRPQPAEAPDSEEIGAMLDEAMYESGIEAALLSCPTPDVDLPEGSTLILSKVEIDLILGPAGLERAELVGLTEGAASDEALACYADVVWELAWPAFPVPVTYRGSWSLAGAQTLPADALEALDQVLEDEGIEGEVETMRIVDPVTGEPGAPIEIVRPE